MPLPYLPPALTGQRITYTIAKEKAPYVIAYFDAKKAPGMTIDEFARRRLVKEATNWWTNKCDAEARELELATAAAREAEIETFKNT